jgi:hypothetical protein
LKARQYFIQKIKKQYFYRLVILNIIDNNNDAFNVVNLEIKDINFRAGLL